MKTKEELNALKAEVETLNKKLAELTEEELEQVSGGIPIHPSSTENHHPKPYIYPNIYAETGMSELRDEAIGQVNGGYDTFSHNDRLCPRCGEYKAFVLYEDPTKRYSEICCTACGYQGSC